MIECVQPAGAVLVLEDVLQAVAVRVCDRVDGVQDDVARLRAAPGRSVCIGAACIGAAGGAGCGGGLAGTA